MIKTCLIAAFEDDFHTHPHTLVKIFYCKSTVECNFCMTFTSFTKHTIKTTTYWMCLLGHPLNHINLSFLHCNLSRLITKL